MTRPNARLIVAFLISLAIGYLISWGIMMGILGTELRLYGFGNLTIVAFLVAFILITVLDSPLKLGTFNWNEPFWPKGVSLPEPGASRSGVSLDEVGNSLELLHNKDEGDKLREK